MDRGKKINDRVNARFIRMVYEFMDEHRDVCLCLQKKVEVSNRKQNKLPRG